MSVIAAHGRRGYKQGCRCDQCKSAEREYQQDLRRRKAEASPGDATSGVTPGLALVQDLRTSQVEVSSGFAAEDSAVAGLRIELERMNALDGALVGAAFALARVLDDPKATTAKAAAAGKLSDLLEQLRKSGEVKKSKLASVRAMTSGNAKIG